MSEVDYITSDPALSALKALDGVVKWYWIAQGRALEELYGGREHPLLAAMQSQPTAASPQPAGTRPRALLLAAVAAVTLVGLAAGAWQLGGGATPDAADRAQGEPVAPTPDRARGAAPAGAVLGGAAQPDTVESRLPPLLTSSPARAYEASGKLNGEGLALHKAGRYAEAAERYAEAVRLDPSFVNARYNLACARSLLGDEAGAVAILRELKEARECALCGVKLALARRDKDFEALWGSPAFEAATLGGAPPVRRTVRDIALEVEAAYVGGEPERLGPLLHSRSRVRLERLCPECAQEAARARVEQVDSVGVYQFIDALVRDKHARGASVRGFERMRCVGDCCASAPRKEPVRGGYGLERVCVHNRSGVLFLARIVSVEG